MLWTFLQSFSFMPLMASDFLIFFPNLYCLCHGNQSNSAVWTKFICLVEDYSRNILKNFCQNICSEIEIMAYFHFSHCKSMEIISCHSDESTMSWATAIKNIFFVEANVMNISTKFQLHPSYGFWRDFWIFFHKFNISVAMATNQIQRFGQNSYGW